MAASLFHTIFLILILLSPFSYSFFSGDLIETTCSSTTYHNFCVAAIASVPHPESFSTADVRGIVTVILSLALANATNSSSYAAALHAAALHASAATNNSIRPLLRACSRKYSAAGDALRWALQELSAQSYDYALIHASAAAEYPATCRILFGQQGRQPTATAALYPPELGRREENLKRLCTVAAEIIAILG